MANLSTRCNIDKLLVTKGVDPTLHRMIVLKAISDSGRVTTSKNLLDRIRRKQSIDKVTVYRILDLLVAKKIIRRLVNSQGTACYEIVCQQHNPHHPHLVCRACGNMECLNEIDLGVLKSRMRVKNSRIFAEEDIDLKVEGMCVECNKVDCNLK